MVANEQSSHPLVACARQLSETLAGVVDVQPLYMADAEKADALLLLDQAARRLAEVRLRIMSAAGDLAEAQGARDIGAWLASRTQAETAPLRADAKLAARLERWTVVAAGMAAGNVSLEQARVITHGLDALPDHIGLEVLAKAEQQLVDYAADFRPSDLRRLARRILEVVAPDIAEGEAAKRLEEEEHRARIKTTLRTKRLGEGLTRTTIIHPDTDADRLLTYLDAYASPRKHPDALTGDEDRIPYPQRLGHAFGTLLERLDPKKLPKHGGDATTVLVTISLESLKAALGTGTTLGSGSGGVGAGDDLSASQVRRLACTAGIIPVVLGGKGEILELGRARRLFSPAQRKALALRDRGCRAEGCGIPARKCEAHHDHPWGAGGTTDLDNARLYCSWHHHRAHDPRYRAELLPNGDVRFTRRR